MKNYYHILGLSFESNPENSLIEAAYKALVKLYHPDIFKGNNRDLKRKISEINEAYEILSDLEKNRPELFGHVLENFVATELLKLMTFCDDKMDLFHFRTSDNKEVDFVVEKPNGQLVAIEVKQRDSVSKSDFKGLEELQNITSDDFVCGVVLYRGKDVVPFGQNLWAIPISNLWG